MLNICLSCGLYRPDKIIDVAGPYAICPERGYRQRFLRLPLFVVSGASGTGKSAVCQYLLANLAEVVALDSDILWRPEFGSTGAGGLTFCETWLRMAKNVGQSGRPLLLFGSALGVPDNIERCVERRYFEDVHYLALVCSDDVLAARLRDVQSGGTHIARSTCPVTWHSISGSKLEVEILDRRSNYSTRQAVRSRPPRRRSLHGSKRWRELGRTKVRCAIWSSAPLARYRR